MLSFTLLGSGSRGNCAYLETEHSRVLIDAGFSNKQIEMRLEKMGRSLGEVQAIFLTHEHLDHVRGLKTLTKKYGTPVYTNRLTAEALRPTLPDYQGWQLFETGQRMLHHDLEIESFAIPHDAYDPVGYLFRHKLGHLGFLTDLGYATQLVRQRVQQARALVLEANHCPRLLQEDTKRPWSVKQRILSRHGHLSNEAAGEIASSVAHDGMEDIFLAHLSPDCNTPALAKETVSRHLQLSEKNHVRLHETFFDTPTPLLTWN